MSGKRRTASATASSRSRSSGGWNEFGSSDRRVWQRQSFQRFARSLLCKSREKNECDSAEHSMVLLMRKVVAASLLLE
jgi:hypothetical protein